MIELILFRHAKTHPAVHGDADHPRRLTPRGWKDSKLVARALYAMGARPDLILYSDATRCAETLESISSIFEAPLSKPSPELYLADAQSISKQALQTAQTSECKSILVIGHNPGMQLLASSLALGDTENEVRIRQGYPTSAAAVFRREKNNQDWVLHTYITPKELKLDEDKKEHKDKKNAE